MSSFFKKTRDRQYEDTPAEPMSYFFKRTRDRQYEDMKQLHLELPGQDDDKISIKPNLTSNVGEVLLPSQEENYFISAFVWELSRDIGFRGDLEARDRISTRLPDLLWTFTLRLETSANSKTEHDAIEFVWQQR